MPAEEVQAVYNALMGDEALLVELVAVLEKAAAAAGVKRLTDEDVRDLLIKVAGELGDHKSFVTRWVKKEPLPE